jgi:predicted dienelactone hydrolase
MFNSVKQLGNIPVDAETDSILETDGLIERTYEYDVVLDSFIHRTNSYLNDVQAGILNPAYQKEGQK